tara:strand:- start:3946 stop:4626 length:681 start_codon:yes stop_codon:yes gene_type:complete
VADLKEAMAKVSELNKSHGVKQRGGKMYTQVVHRMEAFRQVFGTDFGVDTTVLVDDGNKVVIKAIITNSDGMVVGSGMAEEVRGQGHVNTTSALENAETSAIGRALASIGLAGGEYASANEIDAVPRKAEAIKEAIEEAKEKEKAKPVKSMAEEMQKTKDFDEAKDKRLYVEIRAKLEACASVSDVNSIYIKNKAFLEALTKRDAERAKHFKEMFLNYESKFYKGN